MHRWSKSPRIFRLRTKRRPPRSTSSWSKPPASATKMFVQSLCCPHHLLCSVGFQTSPPATICTSKANKMNIRKPSHTVKVFFIVGVACGVSFDILIGWLRFRGFLSNYNLFWWQMFSVPILLITWFPAMAWITEQPQSQKWFERLGMVVLFVIPTILVLLVIRMLVAGF